MTTTISNTNVIHLQISKGLKLLLHRKPNSMIHIKELKPKVHREVKSFLLIWCFIHGPTLYLQILTQSLSNFEFWSFWNITAEELTFCGSPQHLHLCSENINIVLFKTRIDHLLLKLVSFPNNGKQKKW